MSVFLSPPSKIKVRPSVGCRELFSKWALLARIFPVLVRLVLICGSMACNTWYLPVGKFFQSLPSSFFIQVENSCYCAVFIVIITERLVIVWFLTYFLNFDFVSIYRILREIWHGLVCCLSKSVWVEATNERGESVFPPLGGSWSFLKYKIYSKKKDMFPVYTYVFELPFSDIYFTGWLNFSDIFSVFRGLTGFLSGF